MPKDRPTWWRTDGRLAALGVREWNTVSGVILFTVVCQKAPQTACTKADSIFTIHNACTTCKIVENRCCNFWPGIFLWWPIPKEVLFLLLADTRYVLKFCKGPFRDVDEVTKSVLKKQQLQDLCRTVSEPTIPVQYSAVWICLVGAMNQRCQHITVSECWEPLGVSDLRYVLSRRI